MLLAQAADIKQGRADKHHPVNSLRVLPGEVQTYRRAKRMPDKRGLWDAQTLKKIMKKLNLVFESVAVRVLT
jgi:hypothetical protein